MAQENLAEPLKIGTIVKIKRSGFDRVEIVEDRGLLGPKGERIYGVVVTERPSIYFEVREDQIEVLQSA